MEVTQTRLNRFTSNGPVLDVTCPSGYVQNTDTYIRRDFATQLHVQEDEKETAYTMTTFPTTNSGYRRGHLPEIFDGAVAGLPATQTPHSYSLGTTNLAINRSIDKADFYPLTSRNALDISPQTQARLLPYLCETRAVENLNVGVSSIRTRGPPLAGGAATIDYTAQTRHGAVVAMPNEANLYTYRLDTEGFVMLRTRPVAAQTLAQVIEGPQGNRQNPVAGENRWSFPLQGNLAGGTNFVFGNAINNLGLTMVARPVAPNGNQAADGSQYVAVAGHAGRTQLRYTLDARGWEFRLDPTLLEIADNAAGHYTAADGALRFELGAAAGWPIADRPVIDRFDEFGYSVANVVGEAAPAANANLPEFFAIQLWSRAGFGMLTAGLGLNQQQTHDKLRTLNGQNGRGHLEEITLIIPRRRFRRGVATPERLNPLIKLCMPHTVIPLVAAVPDQSPAIPPKVGGPGAPSLATSITYANWNYINETHAFAPRLFAEQIGQNPANMRKFLRSYGSVSPYFITTDSTTNAAGDQIAVQGNKLLHGLVPHGPLLTEINAIRATADADTPIATPYLFAVQYRDTLLRRQAGANPWYTAGPNPVRNELGEDVPAGNAQGRWVFILFTKQCIVAAAGAVPTYISGIQIAPVAAGPQNNPPAVPAARGAMYAPCDFQAGVGGNTIFRAISRTAAIFFGTSFTRPPVSTEFEAGTLPGGGRPLGEYFQQVGGAGAGNPYLRYTVADDYFNHTNIDHVVAVDGVNEIQATPFYASLYTDMVRSLTGVAYIFNIPASFFDKVSPIVRSELYGVDPASSPRGVTMEEPFLGFSGMSVFRPSGIFPIMERLPPFLQDTRYIIQTRKNQNMLVDPAESQLHLAGVSENLIAHLVPVSGYTLSVRADNGFDQTEKELQKANIPYPFIRHFVGSSVHPVVLNGLGGVQSVVSIPPCECTTSRGAPDFMFVRLERVYKNNTRTAPFDPVIQTLKLKIRFQDVKTISDLDATQLYQLTRRNSNFRADTRANHSKYGAVLLRRQDIGNFAEWDGDKDDPFTVSFEANNYDVFNATEASEYSDAAKLVLYKTPIRLVVTFIYKDHGFEGDYKDCAFDFRRPGK